MTTETENKVPETEQKTEAAPAEPAYVITQEELDRLVGTVKQKNTEPNIDHKAIYEKAVADVRKEFETAQKSKIEDIARKAESERVARLEKELLEMKQRTESLAAGITTRKGVSTTTNPFSKTDDGRTAVRRDAIEEATRRKFFPDA
jgi:hypothetical protein